MALDFNWNDLGDFMGSLGEVISELSLSLEDMRSLMDSVAMGKAAFVSNQDGGGFSGLVGSFGSGGGAYGGDRLDESDKGLQRKGVGMSGCSLNGAGGSADSVGTIVIPVYIGSTLLDEVIVDATQRANLRSGGH